MDWASAVDLKQSLDNVQRDVVGDWYRDPWGWPELEWVVSNRPEIVFDRLTASGAASAQAIDVSKENFGTRPAIILDPVDRLAFQAMVDALSVRLIGEQPNAAFGWRLPRDSPKRGVYSNNSVEWQDYRGQLSTLAGSFSFGLQTDVVSCFANIPLDRLEGKLQQRCGGSPLAARIMDMLRSLDGMFVSRSGLPQRSHASAVLANMYLSEVDDLLGSLSARHGGEFEGFFFPAGRSARWMDDVWLFGDNEGSLRGAQIELEGLLREMGLNMNTGKTLLLEGEALMLEARRIDHSAVDEAIIGDEPSFEPLNDLIDKILEHPESASRTSISFASKRMRECRQFDRVREMAESTFRMPHGADKLALLFRESGLWKELAASYVGYCTSPWMGNKWPAAQLGTMFPRDEPIPEMVDYFEAALVSGSPTLEVMAVAADRLASWDPTRARAALRERCRANCTPLEARVLALGGLDAGDDRFHIAAVLGRDRQNKPLLAMLEATNFRPPAKVPQL